MSRPIIKAGFAKASRGLLKPPHPDLRRAGEDMPQKNWGQAAIVRGMLMLCLAGCAPRSSQVAPTLMDPYAYQMATCRELDDMKAKAQRDRIYADLAQDRQYEDDRTRTFGVPTPMASLFEERRDPVTAQTKADSLAINAQLQRSGCVAFNNTGIVALPKY